MLSFAGRRYLITGVLNEDSIAWSTAKALQLAGAEIMLTGTTSASSATLAFRTAAYSLHALTTSIAPLLGRGPGRESVVGIDFDASVAWPGYDWMGVSKAALGKGVS